MSNIYQICPRCLKKHMLLKIQSISTHHGMKSMSGSIKQLPNKPTSYLIQRSLPKMFRTATASQQLLLCSLRRFSTSCGPKFMKQLPCKHPTSYLTQRSLPQMCRTATVARQLLLNSLRPFSTSYMSTLVGTIDKYHGVTVDVSSYDYSPDEFRRSLNDNLQIWRSEDRTCVWIQVPITKSHLISVAAEFGFEFHHAEHQRSLLKLWLKTDNEDKTPTFATHQVGVSGMVYREDTKEVLVVKDKASQFNFWKFPGGLSDLTEDIGDTAEREVLEETGIQSEFLSVLAFRQQHHQPGAFGRSDLFIVCRLKPLTFDIQLCEREISHCCWMDLEQLYRDTAAVSPITHRMCRLMLFGLSHGFDRVDIRAEEMKSLYKGLKYKLYHRPLTDRRILDK